MSQDLAPRFDPRAVEPPRYAAWLEGGYFHASPEAKLTNEDFTTRAPEDVVQRQRDKAEGLREQVAKLHEKIRGLGGAA